MGISKNSNITWDIIQANPDKQWNLNGISCNPNITWDIIKANPNKELNKFNLNFHNKLTAQARIFIAKHQLKAHRQTNYLARYIRYSLVTVSLEYGY